MGLLEWVRRHIPSRDVNDDVVKQSEALTTLQRDLTSYTREVQRGNAVEGTICINRNVLEDALLHEQLEAFFAKRKDR